MNKGGCKIGRKKEPKGGCKVGKKKETKPVEKKRKFNVKPAKPKAPAKPKKIKFNVKKLPPKKELVSELTKFTGLTKTEANKLSPEKLFGMLPSAIGKKILTSGTKVGTSQDLISHIFELDEGDTLKDEMEYMDMNDLHYSRLYIHMIQPSKKPNKKLKSYKAEFSTKAWRDYEKDDETQGNLMDITHGLKFDILSGDSYSKWYAMFKKKMPDYAKYWLEYYKEDLKKKKK